MILPSSENLYFDELLMILDFLMKIIFLMDFAFWPIAVVASRRRRRVGSGRGFAKLLLLVPNEPEGVMRIILYIYSIYIYIYLFIFCFFDKADLKQLQEDPRMVPQ